MQNKKPITGLLQKLGSNRIVAKTIAKTIDKEEFLAELKESWSQVISKNANTEEEVEKAWVRIKKSGYEDVFKSAKITEDDLRQVINEIKEGKPSQYIRENPRVGRNDPCPCGSGKKYKKCCGR